MSASSSVSSEDLRRFVSVLLEAAGASSANAAIVAEHLVESEARGRSSHGLRLVAVYVNDLLGGRIRGAASPRIVADAGSFVRVSGDGTFGQVAADFAVDAGVSRARELGSSVVALSGARHLGRNARWAESAARRGIASLHFAHGAGNPSTVSPFGATERKLGTNPVVFGYPSPEGDFVLDFAVAETSVNAVQLAHDRGEKLPLAAIMLPDGTATDDPAGFLEELGGLLPFGGFKGYGIAVFAQLMGLLASGDEPESGENVMLSLFLDPAKLAGRGGQVERVAAFLRGLREARPIPAGPAVAIPGDRSRRRLAETEVHGLRIDAALRASLLAAAAKVDLTPAETGLLLEPG